MIAAEAEAEAEVEAEAAEAEVAERKRCGFPSVISEFIPDRLEDCLN